MTKGAVMAFEADAGLAVDGLAGPKVWMALIQAVLANRVSDSGYSWVYVTETIPESLQLWHDGNVVLTTPVNTGVPGATTPLGTWPVFGRYTSQTMTGVNPDGTPYSDPGVPWVNYFWSNDAVHGFVRAHYGFPQSDGCVELPVTAAAKAFTFLGLGSLVTVTS
jgi:peptidoglycan hydrolase-like protein with peptidoglycan-binding domain